MTPTPIVTYQEIIAGAHKYNEEHPECRWGQSVFNYIDETYGIAREVQFVNNIDCFYDDEKVMPFVVNCLYRINN